MYKISHGFNYYLIRACYKGNKRFIIIYTQYNINVIYTVKHLNVLYLLHSYKKCLIYLQGFLHNFYHVLFLICV